MGGISFSGSIFTKFAEAFLFGPIFIKIRHILGHVTLFRHIKYEIGKIYMGTISKECNE